MKSATFRSKKILLISYREECVHLPYETRVFGGMVSTGYYGTAMNGAFQSLSVELTPIFMTVRTQRDPEFVAFRKYLNYKRLIRVIAYYLFRLRTDGVQPSTNSLE